MKDRKFGNLLLLFLIIICLTVRPAPAGAEEKPELGGRLEAEGGSDPGSFPLLRTEIEAEAAGDLVAVKVVQVFHNPSTGPMNATYLFPLPKKAAVHAMTVAVGDELIEARIEKRAEAEKQFEQARRQGRSAALLKQIRPNMFSQALANLPPGRKITTTIRYVHPASRVDGVYELVIPLVVGPRYNPPRTAKAKEAPLAGSNWEIAPVPDYPVTAGLDIPDLIDPDRVGVRVNLNAGTPIVGIGSPSHALSVTENGDMGQVVTLAEGRSIDNRDFILRYRLAGDAPQAGLTAHHDDRGGFFTLLIEPPALPRPEMVARREMVFVLDCSGSMEGRPLEASKSFMRRALSGLRSGDYFRIVTFSDHASEFSEKPLPASDANVREALAYVERLKGGGGTEMTKGVIQALSPPVPEAALRMVVFLTDGYIGRESEVLALIQGRMGSARLFAFGVGSAVNRYLLDEMGLMGRGFTRYLNPDEDPAEAAADLAGRLDAPVLTDIRIDWGGLEPADVVPSMIPDLFVGDSIRIMGRYDRPGNYTITLHGRIGGREAKLPVKAVLPAKGAPGGGEAVGLFWARARIAELMREMVSRNDPALKEEVINLGLRFSLTTSWTSFVAVSRKVTTPNPEEAANTEVPLPMVKGVTALAYGSDQSLEPDRPAGGFHGGATPEPTATAGLLVAAAGAGLSFLRRRKKTTPSAV